MGRTTIDSFTDRRSSDPSTRMPLGLFTATKLVASTNFDRMQTDHASRNGSLARVNC